MNQYTAGLDLGSTATKCVISRDGLMVGRGLALTGTDSALAARGALEQALQQAEIGADQLVRTVATGYGRRRCALAGSSLTEISAAALGAGAHPGMKSALILDVGGQDTKVIEINGNGGVKDFLMNDKCAAGTGRFLEMMARVLETDLTGLSNLALGAKQRRAINSTCGVFAESEVVSLLAHGAAREEISAGIFDSIATRIAAMLRQFPEWPILFCGGGALCPALARSLESQVGRALRVLEDPQYVIALGASRAAG